MTIAAGKIIRDAIRSVVLASAQNARCRLVILGSLNFSMTPLVEAESARHRKMERGHFVDGYPD